MEMDRSRVNNSISANNQQQQQRQLLKPMPQSKKNMKSNNCYSINFIRYILQTFNVILFMSGCIITAVAVWSIFWKHHFASLLVTPTYALTSYGLLIAGILATLTAFFGCYVVWRDQRSLICCYSLLLIAVFLLEFSVGAVTYVYESQVDDELMGSLNKTFMTNYGIDETRTNAIDLMQQSYRCCGAEKFEEWRNSTWLTTEDSYHLIRSNVNRLVPDSCCISYSEHCGKSDHPSNIPYTGCIYKFIDEIRDHLNILGAIAFGFCFIKIFGLFLSCCLYFK
ncbi:CD151 antigen-like [Contarinia nasturtii]|uniref:CD151 antigen-like n=1 Tax=Contarinia nasturtii TaxID=265458 RepID=UPI0012D41D95|nr:CD151 antigen-like [Contarinia nasturtii]